MLLLESLALGACGLIRLDFAATAGGNYTLRWIAEVSSCIIESVNSERGIGKYFSWEERNEDR